MNDILAVATQKFHAHFVTIVFIIVVVGIVIPVAFALFVSSTHRRARPKENPTAKFGANSTLPGTWGDDIAKRDRDLEKWRSEHKAQFEQ
jgi:heme/copper-type cytochrome/quinol oxidase subunit 2